MKNFGFILSVMMIITSTIISCSKNDDNPQSVTKKPFAWASGNRDSTGYGMILFSADSGSTWVRQGQGNIALKDIDVWDIWAVDESVVWAVCSDYAANRPGRFIPPWHRCMGQPACGSRWRGGKLAKPGANRKIFKRRDDLGCTKGVQIQFTTGLLYQTITLYPNNYVRL